MSKDHKSDFQAAAWILNMKLWYHLSWMAPNATHPLCLWCLSILGKFLSFLVFWESVSFLYYWYIGGQASIRLSIPGKHSSRTFLLLFTYGRYSVFFHCWIHILKMISFTKAMSIEMIVFPEATWGKKCSVG